MARLGPCFAAVALWGAVTAATAAVVATPNSLAGYTYFPPFTSSGGGGTSSVGDEVSTLQRCVFTPTAGDQTVTVNGQLLYGYTKPIAINYTMAGGDGGFGYAGGGGGSSAILLNGAAIDIARGGNGGEVAPIKYGRFTVKANDSIRLVTGGGGGGGISYTDTISFHRTIGGGGGAGFTGGGAGGSSANKAISTPDEIIQAAGKGGALTPGQGGYVLGGNNGTSGIGNQGGVSTFPDGSSAPIGSASSSRYVISSTLHNTYVSLNEPVPSRIPATMTNLGSFSRYALAGANYSYSVYTTVQGRLNGQPKQLPGGPTVSTTNHLLFGGGGGAAGRSGTNFVYLTVAGGGYGTLGDLSIDWSGQKNRLGAHIFQPEGHTINSFPRPTNDLNLTKTYNDGISGSPPGQIVLGYQAPVCGLLQ